MIFEYQILLRRICCLLAAFFLAASLPAFSNPAGGAVVEGNVTINTTDPNKTIITQTSDKAIINWGSFNVGAGQTTQFITPSATSSTLNRVTGASQSQIFGTINSSGQFILVNPNGILIGTSGVVNAASVIATTANITNANFMAGNLQFVQGAGVYNSVINRGLIKVKDAGLVALVAPGVANHGIIQAKVGKVVLASGTKFTIDLYGDDIIHFGVGSEVTKTPLDENGKPMDDAVSNTGKILAPGGKVILTARTAAKVVKNVINMKGVIEASHATKRGGTIILHGGKYGTVRVAGKMKARGTRGGTIKVVGYKINLIKTAALDTSGLNAGGTILVGGNFQGKGPEPNAQTVNVDSGAQLHADATVQGDGGKIIVWADGTTTYGGSAYARGGPQGGDGGLIETSGKGELKLLNTASANASAVSGVAGLWLLDPVNFTVDNVSAGLANTALSAGTNVTFLADNNVIFDNTTQIAPAGGGATLNIRADADADGVGTVVFNGPGAQIDFSGSGGGTVNVFYNPAGGYSAPESFNANITVGGGSVSRYYMLINTPADLQSLNSTNATIRSGTYALGQNLDMSAIANFTPIGSSLSHLFSGRLFGNGYTINNLTSINPTTALSFGVGLFGLVGNGAVLDRVGLVNVNISSTKQGVAGLIGYVPFDSTITINESYVLSGTIAGGNQQVGALVGGINDVSGSTINITNSFNKATITSIDANIGGIFGQTRSNAVNLNNVYNASSVSGSSGDGAIFGFRGGSSTATNVYFNSDLKANAVGTGATTGITGLTDAASKQQVSYAGFDFNNIWTINEGNNTPVLQELSLGEINPVRSSAASPTTTSVLSRFSGVERIPGTITEGAPFLIAPGLKVKVNKALFPTSRVCVNGSTGACADLPQGN